MSNEVYLLRCFRVLGREKGVTVGEHYVTARRPRSRIALMSKPVATIEAMDSLMTQVGLPEFPSTEARLMLSDEQLTTLGIDPDALE